MTTKGATMATITQVSYGRTFNLRDYQSERIDLTATLDAGEDAVAATLRLKAQVLTLAGDAPGANAALAAEQARLREVRGE